MSSSLAGTRTGTTMGTPCCPSPPSLTHTACMDALEVARGDDAAFGVSRSLTPPQTSNEVYELEFSTTLPRASFPFSAHRQLAYDSVLEYAFQITPASTHAGDAAASALSPSTPPRVDSASLIPYATDTALIPTALLTSGIAEGVSWSAAIRQRLFDRVFTPNASPWMSFSSALGWETNERWSASDEEAEREEGVQGSSGGVRIEVSHSPSPSRTAATAVGVDERQPLLRDYPRPATAAATARGADSPSWPYQPMRRSRLRHLCRYARRHAGWLLFLAALCALQLAAALMVLAGAVALSTAYRDFLLHLRPWGVASCVCGGGIATTSAVLVLSLRRKALPSAVAAVAALLCLLVVLLVLCAGSAWFTWMAWKADARSSSSSLRHVAAVWEAATAETHRRAAAGEATDISPICLFQAAHRCSGFRYGCCSPAECFGASSMSAYSSSVLESLGGGGGPAWARLVCPVCRGGASNVSGSSGAGYEAAPVTCTAALLPLMLRTVARYAVLNVASLCLVVGAGVCALLLQRTVKKRRGSSAGTPARPEWYSP